MAHYDCYECGKSYYDCKCSQLPNVSTYDEVIKQDWIICEARGPWVRNSLKAKIQELREAAEKIKTAYTKDFMSIPCQYIAKAYDDAADAIQTHLDKIKE